MSKDYNMDAFNRLEKKLLSFIPSILNEASIDIENNAKDNLSNSSYNGIPYKKTLFTGGSTGRLKSSIKAYRSNNTVIVSFAKYGKIQNNGGNIKVTPKMKKFFFAKHKETGDKKWLNLAISKKSYITVPARPFIKRNDITRAIKNVIMNKLKRL